MPVALIKDDTGLTHPIHPWDKPVNNVTSLTKIQSSPYTENEHLLDLSTIDSNLQTVAIGLRSLTPLTPNYAKTLYNDTFNFDQILKLIRELNPHIEYTELYVIAFRSTVWTETRESSERRQVLADIDKDSHTEANQSGGLLKYWFGTPDYHGNNLATCFWRSRDDAINGGGGKAHREGMSTVRGWFKNWHVEHYKLIITKNAESYFLIPK